MYQEYFTKLVNGINEFNNHSLTKIRLVADRIEYNSFENMIRGRNNSVFIMPKQESYKFSYEIFENNEVYSKYNIDVNSEIYLTEGFELSKLLCRNENIKSEIHSLIMGYCGDLIEKHYEHCREWSNYLMNWNKHSLSIYKSYEDAELSRRRFVMGLKQKIKEHLELHYPKVILKISLLNKELDNIAENLKDIHKNTNLLITTEFRMSCNDKTLYDYNFDK